MKELEIAVMYLVNGGKAIIHVMQAASDAAKGKGMDSPWKLPEVMLPSQDVRFTHGFQNYKKVNVLF